MVLRTCPSLSACQASISAWLQDASESPWSDNHRRKAAACLICSAAKRRLDGVIGFRCRDYDAETDIGLAREIRWWR